MIILIDHYVANRSRTQSAQFFNRRITHVAGLHRIDFNSIHLQCPLSILEPYSTGINVLSLQKSLSTGESQTSNDPTPFKCDCCAAAFLRFLSHIQRTRQCDCSVARVVGRCDVCSRIVCALCSDRCDNVTLFICKFIYLFICRIIYLFINLFISVWIKTLSKPVTITIHYSYL